MVSALQNEISTQPAEVASGPYCRETERGRGCIYAEENGEWTAGLAQRGASQSGRAARIS